MSNVLPIIEMPKKEPEPEPLIPDNKLPENVSGMDLMEAVAAQCENKDQDDIITVDEREIPEEDEVFSERLLLREPKVAPVLEEEEEHSNEFTPKKGKRKYVRKAPMSDKQKEHLAKIRQIAQDRRKLERERKAKEKEDKLVEKAEQKILQKKQKEEEASKPKPEPIVPKVNNGFTKEDLDSAVLSAISQYDRLRKQQKKEKRESELKKTEEEKMRATLARAIQPQARTAPDPWRNLFA